ncbi:flagellar protein FlaG [Parvibium lacunae]|uniref:Flagellar protein n=1 Tax=Parvibium lacunae TaxID=1888893 RepID=A0A368L3Q6_9BURK|nr:flagellar protein FlaG [Parvibium lacunae]RCS58221.1 flagellar protein [Parvibium lacunae]
MSLSPVNPRPLGSSAISRSEPVAKTAKLETNNVIADAMEQLQTTASPQVDSEKLRAAVATANEFLKPVASNLQFAIDSDSGRTIVKVIDTTTNETLRQIPSPEMLAISKALGRFQGLFVEQKA